MIIGIVLFLVAIVFLVFGVKLFIEYGMLHLLLLPILFSVIICILEYILLKKSDKKHKRRDRIRLANAEKDDRKEQERYQSELNTAKSVARMRFTAQRDRINQEIAELKQQIAEKTWELKGYTCLHDDDKFIGCVDRLIYFIEHRRASNIKEALNLYSDWSDAEVRRITADFDKRQEAIEAERQKQENMSRYYEERAHRERLEELEEKRIKQLEELRKEIEKK